MIMRGKPGCLAQMIAVYNETGGNVISVEECDPKDTKSYGIVGVGDAVGKDAFKITAMVEKPAPRDAPSNLFINGRYILQPSIFDLLAKQQRGAGNEIQLTDAMKMLADLRPFYGVRFNGRSYDCGSKIGFLAANVAFALDREDLRDGLRKELAALMGAPA
jgi:UTP--glucose-1-phosphate uridylyltransferase